ncbi:MAG: hypothetical protein IT379_31185 [Deltaproteobacteria bacterium]|nr:hypothetical protein [Deltaproteobacteria bacterium]
MTKSIDSLPDTVRPELGERSEPVVEGRDCVLRLALAARGRLRTNG